MMSRESPYTSRHFTESSNAACNPAIHAGYSASLLVQAKFSGDRNVSIFGRYDFVSYSTAILIHCSIKVLFPGFFL